MAQKGWKMCGCVHAQIFSVNPFLIGLLLSSVLPAPLWVSEYLYFSPASMLLGDNLRFFYFRSVKEKNYKGNKGHPKSP